MRSTVPSPHSRPPPSLDARAAADLKFIRGTMERAAQFTAVPGRGAVGMGIVALVGAAVAHFATPADAGSTAWLTTWGATAVIGALIGTVALARKASQVGTPLSRGVGRRFALCLLPSLVVGALLSLALVRADVLGLLPATWLLSYGAGIVAAGALSPPVIPVTGAAFLALGCAALFTPAAWGDAAMALGFGVVHVVAGLLVARRHGG